MAGYRRIPQEIKAEVLQKAREGEKVADLATKYAISTKSIYAWLGGKTSEAVSWLEYAKVKKQNQELLAIIGSLTHQNLQLKKKNGHRS